MAYGDLGAVIDTLQYWGPTPYCNESLLCSSGICAVTLRDASWENRCRTFSIDYLGNISDAIIDDLNLTDNTITAANRFCKVSPLVYAMASEDNHWEINLDTCLIYPSGEISNTPIDADKWGPEDNRPGALKKVGEETVAVFFSQADGDEGAVWTIRVYADGTIEHDLLDTLTFTSTICIEPRAAEIHPGIWAIVWKGPSNYGYVCTVSISPGGDIGDTVLDTLIFDAAVVGRPTPAKAHGDYLAIGYEDSNGDGKLAIVEIDESGAITDPAVDTYVFEGGTAVWPYTYSIGEGYVGVAYRNQAGQGILKTFLVDENGSLNNTTLDTLMYASPGGNEVCVFHVQGDVWAITHSTAGPSGRVTSFGLETPPPPEPFRDLMRGVIR